MNTSLKIVLATIISSLVATGPAIAFSMGGTTREQTKSMDALFIKEKRRVAAPFAHVMFCTRSPGECAVSTGPYMIELTLAKKRELMALNRRVNSQINPQKDGGDDTWALAPRSGDCEDYAITKRHALIQLGWPPNALRLAVVHASRGEGHLVLVVRTSKGDIVLDNLTNAIRNWRKSGLRWHLIQSAANPLVWHRI